MISIEKLSIAYIPEAGDYFGEIVLGIGGTEFSVLTSVDTVQSILQYVENQGLEKYEDEDEEVVSYGDIGPEHEDNSSHMSNVADALQALTQRIDQGLRVPPGVRQGPAHSPVAIEEARDPDGNLLSDGYGIPPIGE